MQCTWLYMWYIFLWKSKITSSSSVFNIPTTSRWNQGGFPQVHPQPFDGGFPHQNEKEITSGGQIIFWIIGLKKQIHIHTALIFWTPVHTKGINKNTLVTGWDTSHKSAGKLLTTFEKSLGRKWLPEEYKTHETLMFYAVFIIGLRILHLKKKHFSIKINDNWYISSIYINMHSPTGGNHFKRYPWKLSHIWVIFNKVFNFNQFLDINFW